MYKILLAEDEFELRKEYCLMKEFTEQGFEIIKDVSNGKSALEFLENNHCDLVVTDIRMPFMDGIELLREIRKRKIDVCVIFISSYENFEYARQGLLLGAVDYIVKPPDSNKLTSALKRVKKILEKKITSENISDEIKIVLEKNDIDITKNSFAKEICIFISKKSTEGVKNVTMEETAEYLGFSKDYFGKLFKKSFKMNFNRFTTLVKVEYAKKFLNSGKYKTYQISEILGYSSTDYFAKIFKNVTGKSPTEYKKH